MTTACDVNLEVRARQSLGSSSHAIYRAVARVLAAHGVHQGRLVDVGCGGGGLWREVHDRFTSYCGLDAVRYETFPAEARFYQVDLDGDEWPDIAGSADVVAAVEIIEHLENPWAFMRHLVAIANPGAFIIVTTPNQLSLLSLLTLVTKRRFAAFPDAHFPAHRTALLESDLRRAASESGLEIVKIAYSHRGRLPLVPWHYPVLLARLFPRALSDNLFMVARKVS